MKEDEKILEFYDCLINKEPANLVDNIQQYFMSYIEEYYPRHYDLLKIIECEVYGLSDSKFYRNTLSSANEDMSRFRDSLSDTEKNKETYRLLNYHHWVENLLESRLVSILDFDFDKSKEDILPLLRDLDNKGVVVLYGERLEYIFQGYGGDKDSFSEGLIKQVEKSIDGVKQTIWVKVEIKELPELLKEYSKTLPQDKLENMTEVIFNRIIKQLENDFDYLGEPKEELPIEKNEPVVDVEDNKKINTFKKILMFF